ncbi:glycosyltransferase family 1 protein [Microbulbifer sp. JMSA003]|uniref:glycosyltransferase family 1 protein n=1 Tax=Microbulbifer sp. JMSA003 TaxID=3243369 RepID=UPI00403941C0
MEKASRWLIVEEGRNPSADYFVLPFLQNMGVSYERCGFNDIPIEENVRGANIIFVRYIPGKWKSFLKKNIEKISRIFFFIDDDLFDPRTFLSLPVKYRFKLLRYGWSKQKWLKSVGAQLLVSTPYLQSKYSDWRPRLLQAEPIKITDRNFVNLFYHGSASHQEDIQWLYPVVSEVLKYNQNLSFEIIGNTYVNRLFSNIPRVKVLHPMKWPTYISMLQMPGRNIGLAPLLNVPFNRARSHTKFFDITQAGAVGIYAAGDIYGKVVRHRENGLLLPMNSSQWVDGILALAEDEELRKNMLDEARKCL